MNFWIDQKCADELYQYAIATGGGTHGTRSSFLLKSALDRAENHHFYASVDDVFTLAAIYAQSITMNHPFVDGNKRTAFLVAACFLDKYRYSLNKEQNDEYVDTILNLTNRSITVEEAADCFRENVTFNLSGMTEKQRYDIIAEKHRDTIVKLAEN